MLAVHASWGRFGYPDGLFGADERTHGIHGGDIETSIMLAACPDLVRRDKIADFRPATYAMERDYAFLRADYPAGFGWMTQDLHGSGAVGDARAATAEKGAAVLDHGARAFVALLDDVGEIRSGVTHRRSSRLTGPMLKCSATQIGGDKWLQSMPAIARPPRRSARTRS